MISIKFFEAETLSDPDLTYVVLGARYRGRWIFVRHRDRQSWELPAGHIEPGEAAHEAAARELKEETGAAQFRLKPLCDYSVQVNRKLEFGRLYHAEVKKKNPQLEYEIEELHYSSTLPENLTYPEVQSLLFEKLMAFISGGNELLLQP